jgi:hypothetical protein
LVGGELLAPDQIDAGPVLLNGVRSVFLAGFVGGVLADILLLTEYRKAIPPEYIRSVFYWMMVLVLAVLGGGLTVLYGVHNVQGLLAVNLGASAPLTIKSFASAVPKRELVD